ncbi:hypothetical protein [Zavarzinella formosa]|uniref:hypothetical protein n=1 Tax=Zavarzinella formosa TaxID=360055 RepID=UPI0002DAEEEA|nr:hypothetical protein [Zavarzinella formosa]
MDLKSAQNLEDRAGSSLIELDGISGYGVMRRNRPAGLKSLPDDYVLGIFADQDPDKDLLARIEELCGPDGYEVIVSGPFVTFAGQDMANQSAR